MKPVARTNLAVREVADEAIFYDFERHKAYCLNKTALAVWRLCDGARDIDAIARDVDPSLDTDVANDVVWTALDALSGAGLMAKCPERPETIDRRRRNALKAMIILPAVWSIVAPRPAYAASAVSCIPVGSCMGTGSTCCGTLGGVAMSCTGLGKCTGNHAACSGGTCI